MFKKEKRSAPNGADLDPARMYSPVYARDKDE